MRWCVRRPDTIYCIRNRADSARRVLWAHAGVSLCPSALLVSPMDEPDRSDGRVGGRHPPEGSPEGLPWARRASEAEGRPAHGPRGNGPVVLVQKGDRTGPRGGAGRKH